MKRPSRALVPVLLLGLALPVSAAVALDDDWPWAPAYTDVSEDNRTFRYRNPSAATGQKSAHELSAVRNRGDRSKGRAEAAVKATFPQVLADKVRVWFFGKVSEQDNEPLARLKVYVHCVGEVEDEWVLVGQKVVKAETADDVLERSITVEDCETQTEDGVMLQVMTGERGDRQRRTVFLKRAELGPQGAAVWTEDFTTQ